MVEPFVALCRNSAKNAGIANKTVRKNEEKKNQRPEKNVVIILNWTVLFY